MKMKRKATEVCSKKIIALVLSVLMITSVFAVFVPLMVARAEPRVVDPADAFASSLSDFKEKEEVFPLQNLYPKIEPLLEQEMRARPDERIAIIIVLKERDLEDIPERFDVRVAKSLVRSSQERLVSSLREKQAENVKQHWIINAISAKVPAERIDDIAAREDVEKVWLDREIELIEPVVAPFEGQEDYGDLSINADRLWDIGFNGTGMNISILDTGIDATHPDLDDGKVILAEDFTGEGTTDDLDGHGTHVAGIAAGEFNAREGVSGVAYGASLLNARVLNQIGVGYDSWIIAGIEWSVENQADILCMSLGSWQGAGDGRDPLSMAVTNAVSAGVVVVVAAGNWGPGEATIGNPAVAYGAIAVAASDINDKIASFSSRGPTGDGRVGIDIAAPGVEIIAPNAFWEIKGDHVPKDGTSMAAPHLAGAAALLLEAYPELTPECIEMGLKNAADDMFHDILEQGTGRLDVCAAFYALGEGISVDHEWSVGTKYPETSIARRFTIENKGVNDRNVSITRSIGDAGEWISITAPEEEIFAVPGNGYVTFDASMNVPARAIGAYIGYIQVWVDVGLEGEYAILVPVSVNVMQYVDETTIEEIRGTVDEVGDWVYYTLEVPIVPITYPDPFLLLSLDWVVTDNDLDLYLFDPDGVGHNSAGVDKPEMITISDPIAGSWIVAIHAWHLPVVSETYNLTLILEEGGIISGRVICHAGYPVVDASVEVWEPVIGADGSASTDHDGYYNITGLAPGTYEMWVTPPAEVYLQPASISDIVVIAGETTTVDVTLEEGGIISGRVVCYAGERVVGASISVLEPVNRTHGWAETDHDGYYTTTGLAPGTYEMRVTPPEGVNLLPASIYDIIVIAGETTTVDVTLEEGGIISGRVVCYAGERVVGASVSVWEPVIGAYGWAWTDHDGYYKITGLASGTYEMVVIPPEGAYLASAFIYDIVVIAGETTTVDVTLEEGGIISGRVVCYAGYPVVGALILVWDPVTERWHGWALTYHDGYYITTGLAPGTYEMVVIPPEGAYLASAYIYEIVVIAGETTTVNVTLEEGGIISGRVTCHEGNPVVGAWVDVWDPVTERWHGWALTDHDGYYTTTGLAPGTYELEVIPPEGAYLAPAYIYEIVVIAGETTTVDVILKPYPDPTAIFDTGAPNNPYPSIAGTHTGTITPNQTITVNKFYTYPLPGTGGHTRSVRIWNETWSVSAEWTGYTGDWRNITFPRPFTLEAGERYNYEIITGSYPQIHHTDALQTANGWINCTGFVDVNGKEHQGWIPAIRLE